MPLDTEGIGTHTCITIGIIVNKEAEVNNYLSEQMSEQPAGLQHTYIYKWSGNHKASQLSNKLFAKQCVTQLAIVSELLVLFGRVKIRINNKFVNSFRWVPLWSLQIIWRKSANHLFTFCFYRLEAGIRFCFFPTFLHEKYMSVSSNF